MQLRDFKPSDYEAVRELYQKQGFCYDLPDMAEFMAVQVVVDETDTPFIILAARPTVEMFLIMDKEWATPRWRFEAFKLIHEAMRAKLFQAGITDAHCWLPPEIEKSFAKRLMRGFGWVMQLWPCYSRKTTPSGK
jgi:hypothetical protein